MSYVEVSASERRSSPYAAVGLVSVRWEDGTSTIGSGSVIGRNDILTALHVVYNPDRGGWADEIRFFFGADFNSIKGTFDAYDWVYALEDGFSWKASGWVSGAFRDDDHQTMSKLESAYDVAVIGVSKPVGDTTGWLGLNAGRDFPTWATQVGYPSGSPGMMAGPVFVTRHWLADVYETSGDAASMGRGSSGGPLFIDDGYIIGVKSAGSDRSSTWADIGHLFSEIVDITEKNDDIIDEPTPFPAPIPPPSPSLPQSFYGNWEDDDLLIGSSGEDRMFGLGGDDRLIGGQGNDWLWGGSGHDSAVFSGKLRDYRVVMNGFDGEVTDLVSNRDGQDHLVDIERLVFNDFQMNLTTRSIFNLMETKTLDRIIELYIAFFNRIPEADGLAFWCGESQQGMGMATMADGFYTAGVAYSSLTGYSADMAAEDFIHGVYRNTLGRSSGADADGLAYWRAELDDGRASRSSLVSTILDSAHTFKGDDTWGWVADLLDNKIAVSRRFAVDWGLNFPETHLSITQGMLMVQYITPSLQWSALQLIGIDPNHIFIDIV